VIARDLTDGIGPHAWVVVELDRARAIEAAVRTARVNDIVLICGKGHETEQTIGTTRGSFSDHAVARAAAKSRP
jgi:UDP-N-acetylmuramoyl-L-alanyl-D-glutamate--2,6-diaminopimelate ligase